MLAVGHKVEITEKITDEMVHKFAELSGDYNPMHLDDEYAAKTQFKKRIAHGMICGALISRTLGMKLGSAGVYLSQTMKFMHPVFIDDTVTVKVEVMSARESRGLASVSTNVYNQDGELCVKGEAMIMFFEHIARP